MTDGEGLVGDATGDLVTHTSSARWHARWAWSNAAMPARPTRHRRRRSRGQALVEFALILPVFLLILSGILDFGFMLNARMTVISAAREGARAALNVQAKNATEFRTIPDVARARVDKVIVGTGLTGSLTTTTTCVKAPPAPPAPPATPCNFEGDPPLDHSLSVAVTLTYRYQTFFPLLFGNTITLTSKVQMVLY